MKILIIEDEFEIIESITTFLQQERMLIEYATRFNEALDKIALYEYDCVIVDICLPDGSGLDIIRQMKASGSDTGIIIVSARDTLDDRIEGLNLGADDYLIKPFHLPELQARIKSIIRRRQFNGQNDYIFNEIRVKMESRQVLIGDEEVILTRKEYDLLYYLLVNRDRVLSKESIVEHLWGDLMGVEADSLDFVYTHMRNLRKKLTQVGCTDYIRNVYGVGYKFTEQ